jgi:hypothetical protein
LKLGQRISSFYALLSVSVVRWGGLFQGSQWWKEGVLQVVGLSLVLLYYRQLLCCTVHQLGKCSS